MKDACHHCGKNKAVIAIRISFTGDLYEVCDPCWQRIKSHKEQPISGRPDGLTTLPVPVKDLITGELI